MRKLLGGVPSAFGRLKRLYHGTTFKAAGRVNVVESIDANRVYFREFPDGPLEWAYKFELANTRFRHPK